MLTLVRCSIPVALPHRPKVAEVTRSRNACMHTPNVANSSLSVVWIQVNGLTFASEVLSLLGNADWIIQQTCVLEHVLGACELGGTLGDLTLKEFFISSFHLINVIALPYTIRNIRMWNLIILIMLMTNVLKCLCTFTRI